MGSFWHLLTQYKYVHTEMNIKSILYCAVPDIYDDSGIVKHIK